MYAFLSSIVLKIGYIVKEKMNDLKKGGTSTPLNNGAGRDSGKAAQAAGSQKIGDPA